MLAGRTVFCSCSTRWCRYLMNRDSGRCSLLSLLESITYTSVWSSHCFTENIKDFPEQPPPGEDLGSPYPNTRLRLGLPLSVYGGHSPRYSIRELL